MNRKMSGSVDAFMSVFEHDQRDEFVRLRQIILSAAPQITEGVKWNVPSFYRNGWFATFHTRSQNGAAIILHRGAKVREDNLEPEAIEDPAGLLKWLGKDRAMVSFADMSAVEAKEEAFVELLRRWIKAL
jgi:hypothetical protein